MVKKGFFNNKCRCCLQTGTLINMWDEHFREGEEEIYGEMMNKCFAIAWQKHEKDTEKICELCITRLRDAIDFKKMVLTSEQALLEYDEENKVTLSTLGLLDTQLIKELIPPIGDRALFTKKLKEWNSLTFSVEVKPEFSESTDIVDDSQFFDLTNALPSTSASKDIILPPDSSTFLVANPLSPTADRSGSDSQHNESRNTDLKQILNSSLEGKGLLNLDKTKPLDKAARECLVRIIATSILTDNPEQAVRSSDYENWTREICQVFPLEKPKVYCYSKTVESARGSGPRLVGKLPDRIHNLKRKFVEMGLLRKRQKLSRASSVSSPRWSPSPPNLRLRNDVPTEDVSEHIQWLKNSTEPWDTVLQKWTETTLTRLQTAKHLTISDYFKEYPALQKPKGYLLLEKDFENMYKGRFTEIYDTFPTLKTKIFEMAKKRASSVNYYRDSPLNALVAFQDSSEETSNIACSMLIPTLLTVSTLRLKTAPKKNWRPTKSEVLEGFITLVTDESEVMSAIRCRREKLEQFGLTVQPFIIIVGPSIEEIKSYYVVVDEILYVVPNIVAAIRACFKLKWVVNAKYSDECHGIWTFIQLACFRFKTKFDNISTSIITLLGDLGIDV